MKRQQRIKAFEPAASGFSGTITWMDGSTSKIDLADFIAPFVVFQPMIQEPSRFRRFTIQHGGFSIDWGDDMELAAPTLWRVALEQAGETMPIYDFIAWRKRNGLSQEAAGKVLGISKRQIIDYEKGRLLIPKAVLLATRGYLAPATKEAVEQAQKSLLDAIEEARYAIDAYRDRDVLSDEDQNKVHTIAMKLIVELERTLETAEVSFRNMKAASAELEPLWSSIPFQRQSTSRHRVSA